MWTGNQTRPLRWILRTNAEFREPTRLFRRSCGMDANNLAAKIAADGCQVADGDFLGNPVAAAIQHAESVLRSGDFHWSDPPEADVIGDLENVRRLMFGDFMGAVMATTVSDSDLETESLAFTDLPPPGGREMHCGYAIYFRVDDSGGSGWVIDHESVVDTPCSSPSLLIDSVEECRSLIDDLLDTDFGDDGWDDDEIDEEEIEPNEIW